MGPERHRPSRRSEHGPLAVRRDQVHDLRQRIGRLPEQLRSLGNVLEWDGQRHHEGGCGQGRSVLCLSAGRVYCFPRGWNKQKTPRRAQGNSKGRNEYRQVLRLLPYEKIHGGSEIDGLLHHERDDGTRPGQPTDENRLDEEICEDPGEHQPLVSTAPEQEDR